MSTGLNKCMWLVLGEGTPSGASSGTSMLVVASATVGSAAGAIAWPSPTSGGSDGGGGGARGGDGGAAGDAGVERGVDD